MLSSLVLRLQDPMIYTLYGFAIFFLVFWCALWIIHLLAIFYGKYRLHRKVKPLSTDEPYPGVSILKPLMGTDAHLVSNLETFFTMNYPMYEILFCVEDAKDPAIDVVNALLKKYPNVQAEVFIGGSNVGVNPKINNMNQAYEASSYDLILISDSGIRMKEDTLLDMVEHLTEKTGIVHQMPFTSDFRPGFAATLEKIYFGTAQSRMYLGADLLGVNCHTGMSTLMRKTVLEDQGGLKKFGCYLAEDFFIAKSFLDNGWKTAISSQPALQNSGICDVNSFQARLTRWAKLRVAMLPTVIILEPLSECMVIGACAAWAASLLFRWEPLVFYLIHILVWFLCDWMLLSIIQNGSLPFKRFDFIIGWLFRELSGPYLFLVALCHPEIKWRNRVFKLTWGGMAQEVKP
ncbi:ceramide glucosyltransferase-B [Diabrotica virgifera virgifera]|uniref:ceramide glucosyltransferase n=3 Tax=Diabrotica virgifera virgifera TaxID=50390 RepID=A0ABM5JH50_DIAVI|nr:ceramide glucosyltransferase-B [Diabrotica virgifera virgifera]